MSAPSNNKKYGLIKGGQQQTAGTFVARPSIFGDDSDSDGDATAGSDWVKKAFQRETEKSCQKKQTKLDMQRALEQDPTIYQYDEVYHVLEQKKNETLSAKQDVDRKPKYIASLLKQAEQRKRENERRTERQVQKEREAEGEEFKDKEAFVTSAYRAKLEEFSKQDEEDRYREQLEAFTDVSKQKDLGGFYRHLYRQTVSGEGKPDGVEVKQEVVPTADSVQPDVALSPQLQEEKKRRHYRKRRNSHSSVESTNIDADDSISSSDEDDAAAKLPRLNQVITVSHSVGEMASVDAAKLDQVEAEEDDEDDTSGTVEIVETKQKINIWEKRTVGALFDAALERYYTRKAARG